MRALGNDGHPRFRCGCGAAVTVKGYAPPPPNRCPIISDGRRCPQPKKPHEKACTECSSAIASAVIAIPEQRKRLGQAAAFREIAAWRQELLDERQRESDGYREDRERRKAAAECDVVYYVCTKPGIVKIGTTRRLAARVAGLRLTMADVLAAEPGDRQLEAMRHKEFAELRMDTRKRREDFRLDDRLQSHIRMLVAQYGSPGELVADLLTRQAAELA